MTQSINQLTKTLQAQNGTLSHIANLKAERRLTPAILRDAFGRLSSETNGRLIAQTWFEFCPKIALLGRASPPPTSPDLKIWTRCETAPHGGGSGSQWQPFGIPLEASPIDQEQHSFKTWRDALRSHRWIIKKRSGLKKEDFVFVPGFTLEFDEGTIEEQARRLERLALAFGVPFLVVWSGGKSLHVFWRFASPLIVRSSDDRRLYEHYLKSLALAIGSDSKTCDIGREFRTPAFCSEDRIQPALWFEPSQTLDFGSWLAAVEVLWESSDEEAAKGRDFPQLISSTPAASTARPSILPREAFAQSADLQALHPDSRKAIQTAFSRARNAGEKDRHECLRAAAITAGAAFKNNGLSIAPPPEILDELLDIASATGYLKKYGQKRTAQKLEEGWNYGQANAETKYFKPIKREDIAQSIAKNIASKPENLPRSIAQERALRTLPGVEIRTAKGIEGPFGWACSGDQDFGSYSWLKLPCGVGKSEACKEFIKHYLEEHPSARVLWVVSRSALGLQTARSLGFEYYRKPNGKGEYKTVKSLHELTERATARFVCCIDSIHKLASRTAPDLIILDEWTEQFAAALKAPKNSNLSRSFGLLRQWFQNAPKDGRKIIVCDALAQIPSVQNLVSLCAEPLRVFLPPEGVSPFKGKTISFIKESELKAALFQEFAQDRSCFAFDRTKKTAQRLAMLAKVALQIRDPETIVYTYTADYPLAVKVGNDHEGAWRVARFVSCNGTISSGVSFGGSHFETVFVLLGTWGKSNSERDRFISAGFRDEIQAALRCRGAKRIVFVYPDTDQSRVFVPSMELYRDRFRAIQRAHFDRLNNIAPAHFEGDEAEFLSDFQAREVVSIAMDKEDEEAQIIEYLLTFGAALATYEVKPAHALDSIKLRSRSAEKEKLAASLLAVQREFRADQKEAVDEIFRLAKGATPEEIIEQKIDRLAAQGLSIDPRTERPRALGLLAALACGHRDEVTKYDWESIAPEGIIDPLRKTSPLEYALLDLELLTLIDPDFEEHLRASIDIQKTSITKNEETPQASPPVFISGSEDSIEKIRAAMKRAHLLPPKSDRQTVAFASSRLSSLMGDALIKERSRKRDETRNKRGISIDYSILADLIIEIFPIIQREVFGLHVDPIDRQEVRIQPPSEKPAVEFVTSIDEIKAAASILDAPTPPPVPPLAPIAPIAPLAPIAPIAPIEERKRAPQNGTAAKHRLKIDCRRVEYAPHRFFRIKQPYCNSLEIDPQDPRFAALHRPPRGEKITRLHVIHRLFYASFGRVIPENPSPLGLLAIHFMDQIAMTLVNRKRLSGEELKLLDEVRECYAREIWLMEHEPPEVAEKVWNDLLASS